MNKRKKSIVEHSLALFLEKGIRNTSVQDIIERAGISKGTFYNHFASKTECVNAILEQIRDEARLCRSKLLVGKDAKDPELLAEQIAVLSTLGEKRGIHAIFEEILHSGDHDLKQLVLRHRMLELEWLAERLIEVYGEELRPHAFESAILFYGMLNHLLFFRKMTNYQAQDTKSVAASVIHYMQSIARSLIERQTAVLDQQHLTALMLSLERGPVQKSDAIRMLNKLIRDQRKHAPLSDSQADLTRALLAELEREPPSEAVVLALLGPFTEAFAESPVADEAKTIASTLWYDLKRRK